VGLYLPDHNALFIHCPKTGGSFITKVLTETLGLRAEQVGYKHSHKDLVGSLRIEKNPLTFTLVRHPLSWYASYWQMKLRTPKDGSAWYYWQPDTAWHPNWGLDPSCGSEDFARFITNATAQPDRLHEMFRWYTGIGTRDRADMIGKQETLSADLALFLDTIGVEYEKPALLEAKPVNVARANAPTAKWTAELTERVLSAEARCLLDYGYDERGPLPGPLGVPAARSRDPLPAFVARMPSPQPDNREATTTAEAGDAGTRLRRIRRR